MLSYLILLLNPIFSADLKFAAMIIRHGAKCPSEYYDFDEDNWKHYETNQLTDNGKKQHFLLGTELRRRWITEGNFLSPEYTPEEVSARASDTERTIQSAQSLFKGLFPSENAVIPDLNFNPLKVDDIQVISSLDQDIDFSGLKETSNQVQIETLPSSEDHMFHGLDICDAASKIYRLSQESEVYKETEET